MTKIAMSLGKTKTVSIIVMGILVAAAVIGGVSLLKQQGVIPNGTSGTTISSISTKSPSGGKGNVLLLLHDPPTVPANVSALYINYSDISIHVSGDENVSTSWIDLNQSGTVNLMSIVNFTRTIANVQVEDGAFNALRMNISSAVVTYQGRNFSASVAGNVLTSVIADGGIKLNSSSTTAAALIDISPTVIMQGGDGNSSIPSFVLIPSAKAFTVPSDQISAETGQVGHEDGVENETWLSHEEDSFGHASLNITAVSLTNSSMSVTVKNMGNASAMINTLLIAETQPTMGTSSFDGGDHNNLELSGSSSILFVVLSNGTIVSPRTVFSHDGSGDDSGQQSLRIGYNLSAGASVTLAYSGQIPPVQTFVSSSTDTTNSGSSHDAATTTSSEGASTSTTTNGGGSSMNGNLPVKLSGDGSGSSSTSETSSSNTTTTKTSNFESSENKTSTTTEINTSDGGSSGGGDQNGGSSISTTTMMEGSGSDSGSGDSSGGSFGISGDLGSEWSSLQIVPGQTYVIGIVADGGFSTATVVAT